MNNDSVPEENISVIRNTAIHLFVFSPYGLSERIFSQMKNEKKILKKETIFIFQSAFYLILDDTSAVGSLTPNELRKALRNLGTIPPTLRFVSYTYLHIHAGII